MDKQKVVNEIKATLEQARTEAASLGQEVTWVVCFGDCMTPFRVMGPEIRINGSHIWTGSMRSAKRVAAELDAKAEQSAKEHGVEHRNICAMPASGWAPKRVERLNEMLATLDKVQS